MGASRTGSVKVPPLNLGRKRSTKVQPEDSPMSSERDSAVGLKGNSNNQMMTLMM